MNRTQDNSPKSEKQDFSFINDAGSHREWLKEISRTAKKLVAEGICESVNDFLLSLYDQQGHRDLATLQEWNRRGYSVKKGSRALVIWGRPKQLQKEEGKPQEEGEEQEGKFYPICYLFSSAMVERKQPKP
jgi:hypothetical protein